MTVQIPPKGLSVSAVICTCNRAHILRRALKGISCLRVPQAVDFEVLVVDNNSTDETEVFVREAVAWIGLNLRYVKESNQGLSYARNRGIEESNGQYIIFWDDDAIPYEDYLEKLYHAVEVLPYCRAFGGKTIGVYKNKPDWFITEGKYKLKGILGAYDLGEGNRFLLAKDDMPVGANMIFRKDIFRDYGLFRQDLGRREGAMFVLSMEDSEFFNRIFQGGEKICYLPEARVQHFVDVSRYDKEFLKKVYIGAGICGVLKTSEHSEFKWILGMPRYVIPLYLRAVIKMVGQLIIGNHNAFFYYRTRIWVLKGNIMGLKDPDLIKY